MLSTHLCHWFHAFLSLPCCWRAASACGADAGMEATQVTWLWHLRASVSPPVENRQCFSHEGCEEPSRKGDEVPSFSNTISAQVEFLLNNLGLAGLLLKWWEPKEARQLLLLLLRLCSVLMASRGGHKQTQMSCSPAFKQLVTPTQHAKTLI